MEVRRIRRKLNHLSKARGGCTVMENLDKGNTGEDARNRTPSNNVRYVEDPLKRPRKQQSSLYSDPDETVIVLKREVQQENSDSANKQALESSTSTQHIVERPREAEPQTMHIEFVNMGFNPDTRRDSTRNSSSESNDAQPVYANEEELTEQPIYENNNEPIDDPIYQNTGDLAHLNNPERIRCNTMDFSQIP